MTPLRSNTKVYFGVASVFVLSGAFFLASLGASALVQGLAAIPLVASLVGGLFQIFRDHASHERTLMAQEAQNRFLLGASSHMANIAFDKHVAFCEEYAQEAQKAFVTLIRHGPSEKVMPHTGALLDVRNKYAVWLTPALEANLDRFEAALREIGAMAGYVRATENQVQVGHQKALTAMYNKFAQVMGFPEWEGEKLTDELTVSALVRSLRSVLGTDELTKMRSTIVAKAAHELRNNG